MRGIARISAAFMAAIASLSFTVATASAATTVTTTATVSVPGVTPDTECVVVGSGAPETLTFAMKLDKDTCGQTVKAAIYCFGWVYGPHVDKVGATSVANCGILSIGYTSYGFQVLESNGTWKYVQIGSKSV